MEVSKKLLAGKMMVLAGALFSGQAFAQTVEPPATAFGDFGCNVFDGNGDIVFCDPTMKGNSNHTVLTPTGDIIMKCNCAISSSLAPDKTIMTEGFFCFHPHSNIPTSDTRSVVTKGGRSNLTCTVGLPTAQFPTE